MALWTVPRVPHNVQHYLVPPRPLLAQAPLPAKAPLLVGCVATYLPYYDASMPSSWSQDIQREYPPEREGSFLDQFVKWLDLNEMTMDIERRNGMWSCVIAREVDDEHIEYFASDECASLNEALGQCYADVRARNGKVF